ncbi:MAG: hypothetical protein PHU14_11225 [Methylovulum sp.]|nr:hypothetical protein [Methylovulum sp.]
MITSDDLNGMIEYWLATPQHSRLGSDFGNNASELIGDPNNAGIADDFVKKMLADLPILQLLPPGVVSVYAVPRDFDGVDLFVDVNGQLFQIQSN